jgi:hypothetical protein
VEATMACAVSDLSWVVVALDQYMYIYMYA